MTRIRTGPSIYGATAGTPGFQSGPAFDQAAVSPGYATAGLPALGTAAPFRAQGAARPPAGGLSINLATGQDASGVVQTTGDLADANWTVSNADNYKQAPIAFTTAPDDADWFKGGGQGNPGWFADGPNSCWIAADPDKTANGQVTYTVTFNLTGYDPTHAILQGGQFAIDDQGYVALNGHQIGSIGGGHWSTWTPLSNGAGDFVAGVNTLVIVSTATDNYLEAARLEGVVVDTVQDGPPGPVHWANPVNGKFAVASNWVGGIAPGGASDAILDAAGSSPYSVLSSANQVVNSIQTAMTGRLDITGGVFTAINGTGGGANAGAIRIEAGGSLVVGGSLVNQGAIATGVNGATGSAAIEIAQAATLSGGGAVSLGQATNNQIVGYGAATSLTNLDNTISGSGLIGGVSLALVNGAEGVIDANQSAGLTLDASAAAFSNAGMIEATGDGDLVLLNGSFKNSGQIVNAGAGGLSLINAAIDDTAGGALTPGAALTLTNSSVLGGMLTVAAGATMVASGGDTLTAALTNDGAIEITAGAMLNTQGDVINAGAIIMGKKTQLELRSGSLVNSGLVLAKGGKGIEIGGAVVNTGRIVARSGSSVTILGAVENDGRLKVFGGALTVDGDVTGTGTAIISGGSLDFAGAFAGQVNFQQPAGQLVLTRSQTFAGVVWHFSTTGSTSLDLGDIGFVDAGEATFSGTSHGGVLTVTDGTHTAAIRLTGDYLGAGFVASADGHGGTTVIAQATALRFVAAAAGLGGGAAQAAGVFHAIAPSPSPLLCHPAASGR